MYGGLTDINDKIVTDKGAVIDYSVLKNPTAFKPSDWQIVNLPHDWGC